MTEKYICHCSTLAKKFGRIFNRIMYLSCQRIGISDAFYYNYTKIRVTSYEDLALEKTLNIQNKIS